MKIVRELRLWACVAWGWEDTGKDEEERESDLENKRPPSNNGLEEACQVLGNRMIHRINKDI